MLSLEPHPKERSSGGSLGREHAIGLALIGLHLAMGVAMGSSEVLATAHAAITLVTLAVVVLGTVRLRASVCCLAYVSICDILWRMTGVPVFWETAKLALIVFGLLRLWRWPATLRLPPLAVTYGLLLAPAAVLTVLTLSLGDARQALTFNLGGPFALAVCAVIFLNARLDLDTVRWIVLSLALPTIAIAGLTLVSTVENAGQIVFGSESNFFTSAGFGPNQVSAALGLGALCLIVLALADRAPIAQLALAAGGVGLLAQAALTFSRGGVVNVAVAVVLGLIMLGQRFRAVLRSGPIVILAVLFALLVVVPRLDSFTGGALEERFQDRGTTHRSDIAQADMEIFWDNELLGVGPGLSTSAVGDESIVHAAAHTEYTRVLAEHGLLGVGALVALMAMIVIAAWRAEAGLPRALVVMFAAWALTDMAHAAMRTGAVSFTIALALGCSQMTIAPLRPRREGPPQHLSHGRPGAKPASVIP